jgi:hypothetical protein
VSRKSFLAVAAILALIGCNQRSPTPARRLGAPGIVWQAMPDGPQAKEAQQALENGDQEAAIQILRKLVKQEPANHQAAVALARLLQDQGIALSHGAEAKQGYALFQESAQIMRRLRRSRGELMGMDAELLQIALYNDACALALDDHPEKAMDALEEAIDSGYSRLAEILDDADLKSLHDLPRFRKLMERLRPM